MVDPIVPPAPIAPPASIMNTPPPVPKAPESVLFPTTPTGTPPVVPPAATPPPVVPPAAPTEPTKPTEPTPPVVPATPAATPAELDLKLPEGSLLTAEDLASIQKDAKAKGLTKEQAEGVLKEQNQLATNVAGRVQAQVKAQQDKALADAKVLWKSEVEKDPVLGGEHIAETALLSSRGYHALTTPEERKVIEQTGMDFHPLFVKMMAKVGKLLGEDNRLVLGQLGGRAEDLSTTEAKAARMYGKTTPGANGQKTT